MQVPPAPVRGRVTRECVMLWAAFCGRGLAAASCLLALVASTAIAQSAGETTLGATNAQTPVAATEPPGTAASAPAKVPAVLPGIYYAGGQLSIHVVDMALGDVLAKVASLTGVKIDLPADAADERMPVVELGPGPARQILASLLRDSDFDYLIQASDTDSGRIHRVLLLPREKKGGGPAGTVASRSPNARESAFSGGPPAIDSQLPAQPRNAVTEDGSPISQPAQAPEEQPSLPLASQREQTSPTKAATLSPPQTLSPLSINQQLQQMYQQRIQLMQQERRSGQPRAATSP